jgi:hypothetical protein
MLVVIGLGSFASVQRRTRGMTLWLVVVVTFAAGFLRFYPYLGGRQDIFLTVPLLVLGGVGFAVFRLYINRASLRAALLNNPNLPEPLTPFAGLDIPTSTNAYGLGASFQFSPRVVLNGWVGYTNTRTLATRGVLPRGELDIWNWGVGLALPDLIRPGSVGGLIVGMEPRVTGVTPGLRSAIGRDSDMSFHVEAFYQFRFNDNITITPGVIWLTNTDFNDSNSDVVIGAIRTTFTF